MAVSEEHPLKALLPIVILLGIETNSNNVQFSNTLSPMLVISFPLESLLGITTSTAVVLSTVAKPLNTPSLMSAASSSHSPSMVVLYLTFPFGTGLYSIVKLFHNSPSLGQPSFVGSTIALHPEATFANAVAPTVGALPSNVTLARLVQLENAPYPMLVTLFGIVTPLRPQQPQNAEFPMLVTPSEIVTFVRPVQVENALSPMLFTLPGIVTLLRRVQS